MSSPVSTVTVALITIFGVIALMSPAQAEEKPESLWIASGEVGIGPLDEDIFFHITPRLSYLRPVPQALCEEGPCTTLFEAAFQIPLRLRIVDREPKQGDVLRRRDWHEPSDYFRVIRRIEYGSFDDPLHLRIGEIGPANLGNATLVNGYYNVITTDHYRLGLQARAEQPRWGAEVLVNDLTSPNLVGIRGRMRPPNLYEEESPAARFTVGTTIVSDFSAPTRLVRGDGQTVRVGPDLWPVVDTARPTVLLGADIRWVGLRRSTWSIAPYADVNHHYGLGSGLHTGLLIDADLGDHIHLSTRLEYRLLGSRYVPDYVDPVYEVTRYQHPAYDSPDVAGPKLTAAASMAPSTRYGGLGQFQLRVVDSLNLSVAFSDATGPTGASLRLRVSYEFDDRAQLGLFYYNFAPGAQRFSTAVRRLFDLEGALAVAESRVAIWGPFYAHGQLARLWRLGDDGHFDAVHLFNLGFGAGYAF